MDTIDRKLVNAAVKIAVTIEHLSKETLRYKELRLDLLRLLDKMNSNEWTEYSRRIE